MIHKNYWTVYILCCADNTFYTGITNDMTQRLRVHTLGKASKYTRGRLPVNIVYTENMATRSDALKREARIKKLSRIKKQLLIQRASTSFSSPSFSSL